MAENYVLLETIELTQAAASVTFDNIPQTGYTDLKVVVSGRSSRSNPTDTLFMKINNAVGVTSSHRRVYGFATTVGSDNFTQTTGTDIGGITGNTATANTFSSQEIYIPNYTSSSQKSISYDGVSENNSSSGNFLVLEAALWQSTNAVSSLVFQCDVGNLMAGSTFSLYGIAALGTTPTVAPKATGGNRIENDGTYWIHTFTSTGTFTPQTNLTCDYLVVAGGGGGGSSNSVGSRGGGGGGAGGYRYFTSQSLVSGTAYTATIGAGGGSNSQGTNSSFNSLSATGGGRGGTSDVGGANSGGSGGSGGGAGQHPGTRNGGAGNAGSYSPVEGYAGTAITTDASPYDGAPGGGSSGTATYTNPSSGAPANGTSNSITGTSVTYAAGGRGGLGGAEGAAGTAGTPNTGNGGQGGAGKSAPYQNTPGASGGSGVVIIRYPIAS